MALIKCEDCGNEISDKGGSCIHCGCPIAPNPPPPEPTKTVFAETPTAHKEQPITKNNSKKLFIAVASVFLGFSMLLLLIVFFILLDVDNLNYPITTVLPAINITILCCGALLLFISSLRNNKGLGIKRQAIVAIFLIVFAFLMFPVVRNINNQITLSGGADVEQIRGTSIPSLAPSPTPYDAELEAELEYWRNKGKEAGDKAVDWLQNIPW